MKQLLPLALLTFGLQAPLHAGDWETPLAPGPTSGPASAGVRQSWFGAPNLKFGRGAADSGLPGSPVATISYLHQFDADFDTEAGEVSSSELALWAPIAPLNFGDLHVIAMLGYRMTEFDSPTWHVEADALGPDRDIEVSSLRLGLKLERRFTDHFWAYLTGGVSMAREVEIENSSDTKLLDDDIDPGPFLQFGLNLRY